MELNNLALLTDFYEFTMMQGYIKAGKQNERAIFDLFYRTPPSGSGYAIVAGLAQVIEYIKNLQFRAEDIEHLRSLNRFDDDFLEYLKTFRFSGDMYAIEEGSVVFPNEPLLKINAPIIEAHLIESALLNIINHQSLIATKASRIVYAAGDDPVLELGLRRAQGPNASIYGARAAIIGGCSATSNVLASKMFDIDVTGTHAHSWIMSFGDELTAFRTYAEVFPNHCILLIDTYNTLKSGLPNAIKVFKELKAKGAVFQKYGIRLDSGDLAYLSKVVRKELDEAGFSDAIICASNDLDEYSIQELKLQQAKITLWGVGTNLITSGDWPSFGAVYKIAAKINPDGEIVPKIKISESPKKINNPGDKKIFRVYDKNTNKIKADLITLVDEEIDLDSDLTLFHPVETYKQMTLKKGQFYVKELLVQVFKNGECVYKPPTVKEIKEYSKAEKETLWDSSKRFKKPTKTPVDLSPKLLELKTQMIKSIYAKGDI